MFIDIVLDGGQYNIRIKHRNMIKRNFKKYEITPLNPVQIHNLPLDSCISLMFSHKTLMS